MFFINELWEKRSTSWDFFFFFLILLIIWACWDHMSEPQLSGTRVVSRLALPRQAEPMELMQDWSCLWKGAARSSQMGWVVLKQACRRKKRVGRKKGRRELGRGWREMSAFHSFFFKRRKKERKGKKKKKKKRQQNSPFKNTRVVPLTQYIHFKGRQQLRSCH